MKNYLLKAFFALLLYAPFCCKAQDIQTKTLIKNLNTPWEILWGPDNFIWMTERGGKVSRVNPDNGNREVLITISVTEQSESGLLGMALHPDFTNSPYVFLAYTYLKSNKITEKIVRYEYKNNKLENEFVLIDDIPGYQNHDGCRLVFGPDEKLYISTGDAGNANLAQNRNSINGKILRINPDGTIPADNPYNNSYVWATGSRNSQGLVWANNKLYGSEHGPNSDDEVNIYMRDRNYGWPDVMGFCNTQSEQKFCADSNVVEPLFAWTPTLGVAGIDYYKTDFSLANWGNSLLLTSLKASKFTVLYLDANGEKITKTEDFFVNKFGRLRDICVSPNGRIFISTSNRDGRGNPSADDDQIIEITLPLHISGANHIYNSPKMLQNSTNNLLFTNIIKNSKIEIYNTAGKLVLNSEIIGTELELNCENWNNGLYIIKLQNNNSVSTFKFIKTSQ